MAKRSWSPPSTLMVYNVNFHWVNKAVNFKHNKNFLVYFQGLWVYLYILTTSLSLSWTWHDKIVNLIRDIRPFKAFCQIKWHIEIINKQRDKQTLKVQKSNCHFHELRRFSVLSFLLIYVYSVIISGNVIEIMVE